ncbi:MULTISPECIES: hypothetical protein [Clostridium]|mgnify:CR=1 FL=1|uniref:Uncharacterized protein n=1 Tax=Clostridium nitritogenes TaxID=83340 RepID=A0ABP3X3M5_9CLOT|nr:hypothetical protein [Clostridium baratii]AQM59135.1 hypothetical protein NPD11_1107 [Clostridium baratii]KJU72636.1 hypothetical protein UC77_01235 [Clostridium baratii]MBT9831243.1 hypothetical protein [Clostridium baratii]MDU1855869.1 hypothetical protein [Clostridium baratii]STB00375.1 Uncharacterised protein [Clostridium baratii]
MKKTLILNLKDIKISGEVLDVSKEDNEIISSLIVDNNDEIAIDLSGESEASINDKEYGVCTIFFYLSSIWNTTKREMLIEDIYNKLEDNAKIYIWDINKNIGEFVDSKLKVLLPNEEMKELKIKNNNIISSSNLEECKKILEKKFKIEETKVWEDIYFVKGIKI